MPSTDPSSCFKPRLQILGERDFRVLRIAIEIAEQIFEDDLAAETLAEKRDVRADDRSEVHQDRGLARCQARQKLSQRLGGKHLAGVCDGGGRSRRLVSFFAALIPEQLAHLLRLLRLRLGLLRRPAAAPPAVSLRPDAGRLRPPCPSAPCRRCRGNARLRQSPRAAT